MALLSDVDWMILVVVAAFLLFGRDTGTTLRTFGRWYGRAGRIKQELLTQFSKAADLPPPGPGQALTMRGALLGLDPTPTRVSGIPVTVRVPPAVPAPRSPEPAGTWVLPSPVPTWTMTTSIGTVNLEENR